MKKFKLTKKEKEELAKINADALISLSFLEKTNSPTEIYKHLRENKISFNTDNPQAKKVVSKLVNHKSRLVQLALAEFYPGNNITEKLFLKSKDKEIRMACIKKQEEWLPLWHSLLEPEKGFIKFLKKADDRELYTYFTKKYFRLHLIQYILEKKWPYNKISERIYRNIILILEDNPNTEKKPTIFDYGSDDGYGWFSDDKTYKAFWELLKEIKKLRNLK